MALLPIRRKSCYGLLYKKAEVVPLHTMETLGERKYSSYSFLTSELDWVSGQRHASAALYPQERTSVSIVEEAGWATDPVWIFRIL
jgi:hypothetical protein